MNQAFVFIKPHANTKQARALVRDEFANRDIEIVRVSRHSVLVLVLYAFVFCAILQKLLWRTLLSNLSADVSNKHQHHRRAS